MSQRNREKWEKVELDIFDLDFEGIANQCIVGPQNAILRRLNKINKSYIINDSIYGNRAQLQPLKPLGITPTYRWSPGYKDIINEARETRFDQYEKKTSSLRTMLLNRPARMQWSKQRFIEDVLKLDDELKTLKRQGLNMNTTIEESVGHYDSVMNKINQMISEGDDLFSSSDEFDWDCYMMYTNPNLTDQEIDNYMKEYPHILEVVQFETARIVIEIKFNNPEITLVANRNTLGSISVEPVTIVMTIPLKSLVNALFTKDFGELDSSVLHGGQHRYDENILLSMLNINTRSSVEYCGYFEPYYQQHLLYNEKGVLPQGIAWMFKTSSRYGNYGQYRHPFISNPDNNVQNISKMPYLEKWYPKAHATNVCFGNCQDIIEEGLVNLDIERLISALTTWQTYIIGQTSPLNDHNMLFMGLSDKTINNMDKDNFLEYSRIKSECMYERIMYAYLPCDYIFVGDRNEENGFIDGPTYRNEHSYGGYSIEDNAFMPLINQWNFNNDNYIEGDINYGWNFEEADYWCPTRWTVMMVMLQSAWGREAYDPDNSSNGEWVKHYYDELSKNHLSVENRELCNELLHFVKEYIFAVVTATIEYLDDIECITRKDNPSYIQLVEWHNRILNGPTELDIMKDEIRDAMPNKYTLAKVRSIHRKIYFYHQENDENIIDNINSMERRFSDNVYRLNEEISKYARVDHYDHDEEDDGDSWDDAEMMRMMNEMRERRE